MVTWFLGPEHWVFGMRSELRHGLEGGFSLVASIWASSVHCDLKSRLPEGIAFPIRPRRGRTAPRRRRRGGHFSARVSARFKRSGSYGTKIRSMQLRQSWNRAPEKLARWARTPSAAPEKMAPFSPCGGEWESQTRISQRCRALARILNRCFWAQLAGWDRLPSLFVPQEPWQKRARNCARLEDLNSELSPQFYPRNARPLCGQV